MNTSKHHDEFEDDGPWWRLDFTMVLVVLICLIVLLTITFELWLPHSSVH